jgi:hypothetical protein
MPVNNNKRVLWIFAVRSESPGFLPKSKFSFNLILLFSVSRKKENKKSRIFVVEKQQMRQKNPHLQKVEVEIIFQIQFDPEQQHNCFNN